MEIDNVLVDRLAELSKLEFDAAEKERIKGDLQGILNLIEKLNEVDTDGVQPMIYMNEETTVLREDEVKGEVSKAEALLNAPLKDSDYFRVPKVIRK